MYPYGREAHPPATDSPDPPWRDALPKSSQTTADDRYQLPPLDPPRAARQHRVARREQRIRAAHPRIGGFLLAVTDDPQTTKSWQTGARGEELLGKRLDTLTDHGVRVLHDRRIPGTRANIDHIVISSSGIYVIDAKKYQGRPHLRIDGGILRPRTETLLVGSRDCTKLVDGVTKQVRLVTDALAKTMLDIDTPVTGMLCFLEADWPLIGGSFTTQAIEVLWPKKATERITAPGPVTAEQVNTLHRHLAAAFPRA